MKQRLITLWRSANLRSYLAGPASVHESAVFDLASDQVILYQHAGQDYPGRHSGFNMRFQTFDDAACVYKGPRDNLVLISVGHVTPTGYVTMSGRVLTPEEAQVVDAVRERNAYHGYSGHVRTAPIAGAPQARPVLAV